MSLNKKNMIITLYTLLLFFYIQAAAQVARTSARTFTDIPPGHWAYKAVKTLVDKKILQGFPDNTFKGDKSISRLELAVVLGRFLDSYEAGEHETDLSDMRTLITLLSEFADELPIVGMRITAFEQMLTEVAREIEILKAGKIDDELDREVSHKITITGDAWVHIENQEYDHDTVDDDLNTYYRIGLNMSAPIAEDLGFYCRLVNEPLVGRLFGQDFQDNPFEIDLAYIDIRDFFNKGDIRIGRQFFKFGHSIALDNILDSITYRWGTGAMNVAFVLADMANATSENGFGLKGLDLTCDIGDHTAEVYYIVNSTTTENPANYGLALDGGLLERVCYLFEFGQSDPDTAGGLKGDFWLAGIHWAVTDVMDIDLIYGEGDEEYNRVAGDVYYFHRFKDMFGRIYDGDDATDGFQSVVPDGRTNASGSLVGIRNALLKISSDLSKKTTGCFIYENVMENDTNSDGDAAPEFRRFTLGLDHYYKPNTTFGVRYDTVVFDSLTMITDAGGWYRLRVDMKVKF